jgi:hypothetical protein
MHMKKITCLIVTLVVLAGVAFAGNTRVLLTVPVNTLAVTNTITSAQLGVNATYAEITGVSYVFSAASLTNLTGVGTVVTAGSASLPIAATLGTGTAALSSSTAASTAPVVVGLGEKIVWTGSATNDVAYKVIYHLRTSQ